MTPQPDPQPYRRRNTVPHRVIVATYDRSATATCTCGWSDEWSVADGSAQEAASEHIRQNSTERT